MNPLEIYKLLPKTNCGECPQKTCMSFAVYVKTNPDTLGQCNHIEADKLLQIQAMLLQGDWRDELIKTLSAEVRALSFEEVAGDLGCIVKDGNLVVRCIGVDYTVEKDGTISPDRGNKWIKILLLHYIRNRGKGDFTGKWISFSELKSGLVKASSFRRECEEPLRELFDGDPGNVTSLFGRLGAVSVSGYPADCALSLDLLPKIRSLILYRQGDEEFPSSLNILFDGIAGNFLDVESLTFLCEGLVHTITKMLEYAGQTSHPRE